MMGTLGALLAIWILCVSANSAVTASKKSTTDALATARINDAVLFLSTVDSQVLHDDCKKQIQPLQIGLLRSEKSLAAGNDEEAIGELSVVEAGLDGCLLSMSKMKSSEAFKARAGLRKVGRSVSNAEQLIQIGRETLKHTTVNPGSIPADSKFPDKTSAAAPIFKSEAPKDPKSSPGPSDPKFSSGSVGSHLPSGWLEPKKSESMEPKPSESSSDPGLPTKETETKFSPESASPFVPAIASAAVGSGDPLTSIVIDYCGNHVKLKKNSASIRLDKACGAKFHSMAKYTSGVFSAWIRTPVKAAGVSSSFYITSDDLAPDTISFDFYGNTPSRISTSYGVQGDSGSNQEIYAVSFDTSVKFHKYTIKWDAENIMWLVDGVLFRTVAKTASQPYPTRAGSLYGLVWDASHVGNGALAGTIDWKNSPFNVYYDNILVSSPLVPGSWKPPPETTVVSAFLPAPMRPLAIDYCGSNIDVTGTDVAIKYDETGCGGRFRSISRYPSGTFTARVRCAAGDTSGLLSSFYLSSLEGSKDQDEIDFEWLGFNRGAVQTNFHVNGRGGNEDIIDLGFDCSEAFHKYTIKYNRQQIQWLVDDKVVRSVTFSQQSLLAGRPYPVKPMYVYASVWNASEVNNGRWAGKWHGVGMPYTVTYSDITIKSSS